MLALTNLDQHSVSLFENKIHPSFLSQEHFDGSDEQSVCIYMALENHVCNVSCPMIVYIYMFLYTFLTPN